MSCLLKVKNLFKQFKTDIVLKNISFEIEKGKIVGFVGRNGSGKSVLFKIICGLYLPTSGNVVIFDEDISLKKTYPKNTRAVIDEPSFLEFKSGIKNLEYLSLLSGKIDKVKIENTLEIVDLPRSAWRKKVKHYSMGMKQKLALAQILMDEPEFIILDEPFNGLDEHSVSKTREIIKKLKSKGVTIILSSHIKEDIDYLCDIVYQIKDGELRMLKQN